MQEIIFLLWINWCRIIRKVSKQFHSLLLMQLWLSKDVHNFFLKWKISQKKSLKLLNEIIFGPIVQCSQLKSQDYIHPSLSTFDQFAPCFWSQVWAWGSQNFKAQFYFLECLGWLASLCFELQFFFVHATSSFIKCSWCKFCLVFMHILCKFLADSL